MKKVCSILLCVLLITCSVPAAIWAGDADVGSICTDENCGHAAQIGDKHFTTLQGAIDTAEKGQTITVINDVNLGSTSLEIKDDQDVILDLNGKVITSQSTSLMWIDGSLRVVDTSETKDGCLQNKNYCIIANGAAASVTIEDGTIVASEKNAYRQQSGGSKFVMKGGKLESISGTAIFLGENGSDGRIEAGEIIGKTGVALQTGAQLQMTGGHIKAKSSGINVLGYNGGATKLIMSGGQIESEEEGIILSAYDTTPGTEVTISDQAEISGKTSGILVYNQKNSKECEPTLIVRGGEIYGGNYGISGNGSKDYTKIQIEGGKIRSELTAVYHPQIGDLIIGGNCDISGLNGVQYSGAGSLFISGGSLTGTLDYFEKPEKPNTQPDGPAKDGAALSLVSRGGGYQDKNNQMNVKITGGVFTSQNAAVSVYRLEQKKEESGWSFNEETCLPNYLNSLQISGGVFKGGRKAALDVDPLAAEKVELKGGTYSSDPTAYIISGYQVKKNTDGTYDVYYPSSYVPAPTPDNVTNDTTDKTTTADVNTTTTTDGKAEATVDKTTADKIIDKAVANKSEEVIIDATTTKGGAKSAEVKVPAETVKAIVEKTDADVIVKTDTAEVALDQKAAEAVAEKATTGTVSIIVEKVKEDESRVQLELKIVTENGNVIDFKGGNAKVTIALPEALKDKEVVCIYIDEDGSYVKMEGKKNIDGTYTFTTGHFSTYAVMTAEEADKIIAEQEKAKNNRIKAGVKATTIKASSSAKKGSITIKWKKSNGFKVDYFQVFRSTKKNSGYGTKAFYTTKSGTQKSYKNTKALKKGTRYYYKVRGVRTIDGEKVYTKWSNKAIRIAK